jgi:RNA polymerase sigma-70 factor (ECF subfamily)
MAGAPFLEADSPRLSHLGDKGMGPSGGDVAQLLAAARAGSREALGEALQAYRAYLLLIAQQELDPDLRAKGGASDLVQETFIDAQRLLGTFEGDTEGRWAAWLRELLLNNLADFVRRYRATGKRRISREVGQPAGDSGADRGAEATADTPSPSVTAMAAEQSAALERALGRLPEDYREVLLLRYQGDLSFEEIGGRLGRSANAARKLRLRALRKLEQELEAPP